MRATAALLLAWVALVAAPRDAAAADRLCDPAFEDCRAPLLALIEQEPQAIDAAFWFMEDPRYATALIARHRAGVAVRVLIDRDANLAYPENATILAMLRDAGIPMRDCIA